MNELSEQAMAEELLSAHSDLRGLAQGLKEAVEKQDIPDLQERADQMYWTFLNHAYSEETTSGFFGDIAMKEPRLVPTIKKLREEHDEILSTLSTMRHTDRKKDADLLELAEKLLEIFVRHEKLEDQIIHEHFFRDHGGG